VEKESHLRGDSSAAASLFRLRFVSCSASLLYTKAPLDFIGFFNIFLYSIHSENHAIFTSQNKIANYVNLISTSSWLLLLSTLILGLEGQQTKAFF